MSLLPEVESALLDAIRRDQRSRARTGVLAQARHWVRGRSRGLLVAVGVVVLAGTAAAAVSLSSQRSRPLSGAIAGWRYQIGGIEPSITAGSVGWCESYWVHGLPHVVPKYARKFARTLHDYGEGAIDCGPAPARGLPIFAQASQGPGGPAFHAHRPQRRRRPGRERRDDPHPPRPAAARRLQGRRVHGATCRPRRVRAFR